MISYLLSHEKGHALLSEKLYLFYYTLLSRKEVSFLTENLRNRSYIAALRKTEEM